MALTFKEIWSRYSQFEVRRTMFVKRLRRDGAYEDDWQEISQGQMQDGSISRMQRALPNSSYQFGKLQVANANMRIMSAYREFADESIPGSIFRGFIRHWSKIKVVDSIIDKYTNDGNTVLIAGFDGDDGDTTYTAETGQVFTFEGNAELDDAQSSSGSTSLKLDGLNSFVSIPDSDDWDFGDGDFTFRGRVRIATLPMKRSS